MNENKKILGLNKKYYITIIMLILIMIYLIASISFFNSLINDNIKNICLENGYVDGKYVYQGVFSINKNYCLNDENKYVEIIIEKNIILKEINN